MTVPYPTSAVRSCEMGTVAGQAVGLLPGSVRRADELRQALDSAWPPLAVAQLPAACLFFQNKVQGLPEIHLSLECWL